MVWEMIDSDSIIIIMMKSGYSQAQHRSHASELYLPLPLKGQIANARPLISCLAILS